MEISPARTTSQSIQCDENGKSYLELGSYTNAYSTDFTTTSPSSYSSYTPPYSPPPSPYFRQSYASYSYYERQEGTYGYTGGTYAAPRGAALPPNTRIQRGSSPSCDPTRTSPRPACYTQQRLSVLNMSMVKLNRFSRFPEPSLHRSVLICNTLKHIEREMESEGLSMAALLTHPTPQAPTPPTLPETSTPSTPSLPPSSFDPSFTPPEPMETPTTTPPSSSSEGGINWCSVLSLSSQTDLDSMNNNECHEWNNENNETASQGTPSVSSAPAASVAAPTATTTAAEDSPQWKLPSLSAEDVLKTFPEAPRRQEEEIDSIMKVLVGS